MVALMDLLINCEKNKKCVANVHCKFLRASYKEVMKIQNVLLEILIVVLINGSLAQVILHGRSIVNNFAVRTEEWPPTTMADFPYQRVSVTYASDKEVTFGNQLFPADVTNEPTSLQWPADPYKHYTVLMFDPDAPNGRYPVYSDICHWLVVNIRGSDVSSGDVIVEYVGAKLLQSTGSHRYFFLVFEQQRGWTNFAEEPHVSKNSQQGRFWFPIKKFATQYGLGRAVAGNYFILKLDLSSAAAAASSEENSRIVYDAVIK